MDSIKVKHIPTAVVATDALRTEFLLPAQRENELTVLKEWEIVLASGGEGMPCW